MPLVSPTRIVREILLQAPAVVAIVGARIGTEVADRNDPRPHLVLNLIGSAEEENLAEVADMDRATVACQCWGDTFDAAETLALAVKGALRSYRGTIQGHSVSIRHSGEAADFIPAAEAYRRVIVWEVTISA